MRILFDTNVLLDVLLARAPFAATASRLLSLADRGEIEGVLGATTVTTLHYLINKAIGRRRAFEHVRELLAIFTVAPVDHETLVRALEQKMPDFEDAVLVEAARAVGAEGIVTRNRKDFAGSKLLVYSPEELLSVFLAQRSK